MFKTLLIKEFKGEGEWIKWMCIILLAIGLLLRLKMEWHPSLLFILVWGALILLIFYRAIDIFVKEWRHKTTHLLFSLPVPRWEIVLAKFTVIVVMTVLTIGLGAAIEVWLAVADKAIDFRFNMTHIYWMVAGMAQIVLTSSILIASKVTSYTVYRFRKLFFVVLFILLSYLVHRWLIPFTSDLLSQMGVPKVKVLITYQSNTGLRHETVDFGFWSSFISLTIWTLAMFGLSSISIKKVEVE